MTNEEKEAKDEGEMQMAYKDSRENGIHKSQYGQYCKCVDCQIEKSKQEKQLTQKPF